MVNYFALSIFFACLAGYIVFGGIVYAAMKGSTWPGTRMEPRGCVYHALGYIVMALAVSVCCSLAVWYKTHYVLMHGEYQQRLHGECYGGD